MKKHFDKIFLFGYFIAVLVVIWSVQSSKAKEMGGTMTSEQLNNLTELANELGAEGVWLVRNAKDAHFLFGLKDLEQRVNPSTTISTSMSLDLADSDLFVIIRFPAGDGGEAGLEVR